jgi:predicted MFS family arabinose efflux permease
MGLVAALAGAGQLAAGLFAGQIADLFDRRRLMLTCELARSLLLASIPLTWSLAGPSPALLYPVAFACASLGMLFQVAFVAQVPRLVGRDRIVEANGRLETSRQIAFVLGPALAGFLSGAIGPERVITIDAVTFLASALSVWLVPIAGLEPSGPRRLFSFVGLLEGARFIARDPVLRAATVVLGTFTLVAAGAGNLVLYHLEHDLGQSDAAIGLVAGMASVGGALAAVTGPLLRRRFGFGACFLGGTALHGAALGVTGMSAGVGSLAPAVITSSFADVMKGLSSMSVRQQLTPDHMLGRVTSAYWLLTRVLAPVGAGASAAAAAAFGARPVLLLIGFLGLAVAAFGSLTPARTSRPEALSLADRG